nr:ribonuclease H-like domain-containing protein [Tanacetum cinerariifolium]
MLRHGDYEIWRLRIEQYFQVQDYDLWDVIENGNTFKLVAHTTTNDAGTLTTLIPGHVTTEEKAQKKNDVMARRQPRNQDSRNKNQDSLRRPVNMEDTSSKAMVAIDGADSEVHIDKTYSKTHLKSFETLKTQLDNLRIELNTSEFNLATYKRGLASIEEQLVFYKKNEVIFCEKLVVLNRDISYKDSKISMLKSELEKLKQEKESNQLKIKKFDNASKSLDKLIGSQIPDNSRKGVGFISNNDVPPPHTGLFSPPNINLSYYGLEEFKQPEFESYRPKSCEIQSKNAREDIPNELKESPDAPLVKDRVSDNKYCSAESPVMVEKKTVVPTIAKVEGHPQKVQKDQGYVDGGCSRDMTENMSYLSDFKEFNEGYVTFGGGANGGRITGNGTTIVKNRF